jgi:Leucine-rich repeat (LRR) protein
VDLSNCELSQLPPELFELSNLVELSLAGNQLRQLPADIGRLSSLQRLVLAGNWLEHLPQVWATRMLSQCCGNVCCNLLDGGAIDQAGVT